MGCWGQLGGRALHKLLGQRAGGHRTLGTKLGWGRWTSAPSWAGGAGTLHQAGLGAPGLCTKLGSGADSAPSWGWVGRLGLCTKLGLGGALGLCTKLGLAGAGTLHQAGGWGGGALASDFQRFLCAFSNPKPGRKEERRAGMA